MTKKVVGMRFRCAAMRYGWGYVNAGKVFKRRIKKGQDYNIAFWIIVDFAMGYWDEAIKQPRCVSTLIALILVFRWELCCSSTTADVIIRPILDLMQTMPAFVYLIPAIFFFSVGNTPGVATVIFSPTSSTFN
jgi:glycine betaine/proline transport system permease protein